MAFLTNPAFVAFLAFGVFAWTIYSSVKIENKTSDVWQSALFNFVLLFVIMPLALMFGSYFAKIFIGVATFSYAQALIVSSVILGFFYFVKLSKKFM